MNNAKGIIQDEVYFITTTVVNWIDIFTRPKYKHIVLESLPVPTDMYQQS